jgi:hypothetical protein
MKKPIVAIVAALLIGCTNVPPVSPDMLTDSRQQLITSHFVFRYTDGDANGLESIAAAAEAAWQRVTADLGVTDMPRVRVTFYATHADLARAVLPTAGVIPGWATGLVTSSQDIHLLSPRAAPADAALTVVHEFAHCVTLHIDPGSGNNPRWLWETVAIYEAGQRGDPARVDAILDGPPPSLATLNSFETTTIYDIGYLIGAFIVERNGPTALRELVRSRGNTDTVLGLSAERFIDEWAAWARR